MTLSGHLKLVVTIVFRVALLRRVAICLVVGVGLSGRKSLKVRWKRRQRLVRVGMMDKVEGIYFWRRVLS